MKNFPSTVKPTSERGEKNCFCSHFYWDWIFFAFSEDCGGSLGGFLRDGLTKGVWNRSVITFFTQFPHLSPLRSLKNLIFT